MAGRQAHLNRFRTIPAPPAPAARLRPSAPLRRVHTTPQAAARPAAGCPAAAHRLPGPDGRFERAQRKTRGSRQAHRGTWPPPTPSAEVELSTARNGALTSRYGIERTETAFKRIVTPANTAPARRALVPVPRRLRAALPSCRPAALPDGCYLWRGLGRSPNPTARRGAPGRRARAVAQPHESVLPRTTPPRPKSGFSGRVGVPQSRGGLIFNKAFLSGFHFVWE